MKKIIVLFVSFVLCGQTYCLNLSPSDSLTTQALSEKIDKLNTDFVILKAENETLQKANDRISTSVYFTVGIILASFFGLGIFNYYQGNKLNTQKMENLVQASKNEIDSALPEKITKIVDSKEIKESSKLKSEISSLSYKTDDTNRELRNYKEKFLIAQLPNHPFHTIRSSIDNLMELIELQLAFGMGCVDISLEALIAFLKGKEYMSYDQKNRITEIVNKELKDRYPQQIGEIRELLKTRVD